jgi:hypothetical protein
MTVSGSHFDHAGGKILGFRVTLQMAGGDEIWGVIDCSGWEIDAIDEM